MPAEDADHRPKPVVTHVIGADLLAVSQDELSERIALLEREIARIREEQHRKTASRAAADAFFKS